MSGGKSAPKQPRATGSNQMEINARGVPNPRRSDSSSMPPIFKLTSDCCDEFFEYLTLRDLHSFGQTCKAMNRVAGDYFKRNYCAQWFDIDQKGLCSGRYQIRNGTIHKIITYLPGFHRFVTKVSFDHWLNESLLMKRVEEFSSIKHVKLRYFNLDPRWWNFMKTILPQIETLNISGIRFNLGHEFDSANEFYAKLLEMGVNLKGLSVDLPYVFITTHLGNQKYPKLNTIGFEPTPPVDDLETFFAQNPNVRTWRKTGLRLKYIRAYNEQLLKSTISLDTLVMVDCSNEFKKEFVHFIDFFNQLYRRGFFKRLHLRCDLSPPLRFFCFNI